MKKNIFTCLIALWAAVTTPNTFAQTSASQDSTSDIMQALLEKGYQLDSSSEEQEAASNAKSRRAVITNPFPYNLFVEGSAGAHTFLGDFHDYGPFKQTISPDFYLGVGKWLIPAMGVKVEVGMGESQGFMDEKYPTPYCYGDLISDGDLKYWRTSNKWMEVSLNGMLNISRAIYGYEGNNTRKLMNQFFFNFGVGFVHHLKTNEEDAIPNELNARAEIQYSRFFSPKKNLSLDIKPRIQCYETDFDQHLGHAGSKKIDANLGLSLGLTYYFKHRGWDYNNSAKKVTHYMTYAQSDTVLHFNQVPEMGQMTFYVFFPNNYSGRDDAPTVKGADVNAIDYIAGGIFTQKKYKDDALAGKQIAAKKSMSQLECVDIPTVKSTEIDSNEATPRGYEICGRPLTLSVSKDAMQKFHKKSGYYYAPIHHMDHSWYYRVDNAAVDQILLSADNYKETASFGINGKNGLEQVRQYLHGNAKEELYSFADIYAALEGNKGYIAQYADGDRVAKLQQIFKEGTITNINVTGVATAQDNSPSEETALGRNSNLAKYRTQTVFDWLTGNPTLSDAKSQIFLTNELDGPVRTIKDNSTNTLNAKLNRCVKVTISYMLQPGEK